MKTFFGILLSLLMTTGLLHAQARVGLVLPFENETRDPNLDWIGESFVEVLSNHLNSAQFLVVDRRERAAAFDILGVSNSTILSNATIYKAAELLDTDNVILGRYEYQDGVLTATAQILNMEGPTLSKPITESGPLPGLLELEASLAWQIQNQLRPDYPVSRTQYVSHRNGPRLDAFESYIRGLLSRDRNQKIQYLRSASVLDPRFTEPAFAMGMIYYKDHDYRTAILWLSKIRSPDPDYLEANYFLGLSYLYQAQYDRAAASFRVVEKELPLDELYNNLGIALERSDRPGSIFYFEKAVASDPTDRDYQFNLGYAYWKRDDFGQAAEHLLAALEGNGSFPPSRRAILIDCLGKLGRAREAEQQTRLLAGAVVESDLTQLGDLEQPRDEYDGVSFRHLRRLMQIQEELKHARLSESEHIDLHFSNAMEDLKQGLDRQAIQELQQVIDYNPQDARAYLELAKMHFRTGRNDDALDAVTRSLQWEQSPEAFVLLARIHLALGKPDDALDPIDSALALDPANPEAMKLKEDQNARAVAR